MIVMSIKQLSAGLNDAGLLYMGFLDIKRPCYLCGDESPNGICDRCTEKGE